ncbi:MAG: molybdopterin molybdotransferase MoeA [Chloroflexota bacterium]|nr:molybdopterin molybdotransferase MoeA [Chloroflexota bacterium]
MRPPDEARAIIDRAIVRLPSEAVPLAEAAWRVLAGDLVAPEDHPPFLASTMDGFAVVAEDSSPWREILGDQHAGHVLDEEVTEGYTVRIMTGAPVPRGANAVVPVEATELAEDHVVIHKEDVAPGENVRPIGSDVRKGDLILPDGTVLGPAEIGLVANMGVNPVTVTRLPRVSVLSTGNELVDPGDLVGPGQIRDSNRFSLMTALQNEPCEITYVGKAPDERVELERFLRDRLERDDVIVTSGGVSMGDLDLVKVILFDAHDITVHFRRLYLKPGKPLNFATSNDTLIFGLPGNPVSSLVTFELFIRPALRQMAGANDIDRPRLRVRLEAATPASDRIEFQRGIVSAARDGTLTARSTGPQQSSRLASFVGANALLMIPPRERPYAAGEEIDALMLGSPRPAPPSSDS